MAKTADRTSRIAYGGLLLAIASSAFLSIGCSSWESFRQRSSDLKHKLFDNAWEDPEAPQKMARGEQFYAERNYDAAIKEFKAVADNEGNNVEMRERARFLQAESRRFLFEYPEACDTYHKLLQEFHPGMHRADAVARMYEIADYWLQDFRDELNRRSNEKGVLRWKPSWPNPLDKTRPAIDQEGRALEAMENIHTQDITGPLADKALFWCGYVHFVRGNFLQADRFFSELVELHRESLLRPQALAYAIQAKNNATGGAVYDGRKCAEALQLVHVAEATVPELTQDPEMADKLTRAKFAIRSQQAEKDFRMAEYYERTGHPGSAVFYYELVRRRFAGTRYADIATERKEILITLMQEGHPSAGVDPIAIAKAKWKENFGQDPLLMTLPKSPSPAPGVVPAGGIPPGGGGIVPGMGVVPGAPPGVAPGSAFPTGGIPGGLPPSGPAGMPPGIVPGAIPPGPSPGPYSPGPYGPVAPVGPPRGPYNPPPAAPIPAYTPPASFNAPPPLAPSAPVAPASPAAIQGYVPGSPPAAAPGVGTWTAAGSSSSTAASPLPATSTTWTAPTSNTGIVPGNQPKP